MSALGGSFTSWCVKTVTAAETGDMCVRLEPPSAWVRATTKSRGPLATRTGHSIQARNKLLLFQATEFGGCLTRPVLGDTGPDVYPVLSRKPRLWHSKGIS